MNWTENQVVVKLIQSKLFDKVKDGKSIENKIGCPDFWVQRGDQTAWIEVKSKNSDSLSYHQLQWISNHKNERIILAMSYDDVIKFFHVFVHLQPLFSLKTRQDIENDKIFEKIFNSELPQ